MRVLHDFHCHLDGVRGLESHDGVPGVDGPHKGVRVLHPDDVGYRGHVQLRRQPAKTGNYLFRIRILASN